MVYWIKNVAQQNLIKCDDGKIGMDGGAVYLGGVLHGIVFTVTKVWLNAIIENDGFVAED